MSGMENLINSPINFIKQMSKNTVSENITAHSVLSGEQQPVEAHAFYPGVINHL